VSSDVVQLPDLRAHQGDGPPRAVAGWFVLATDGVSVPSLEDAVRCEQAAIGAPADPCATAVAAFDPPNRTTIVGLGAAGTLTVRVKVTPGFPAEEEVDTGCPGTAPVFRDKVPVLHVASRRDGDSFTQDVTGQVLDPQRQQLLFVWEVPAGIAAGAADGLYALSIADVDSEPIQIDFALGASRSAATTLSADPCALTLVPGAAAAGRLIPLFPAQFPRPPLLAVDASGCSSATWSVDASGRALLPNGDTHVLLLASCRGGVIADLQVVNGGVAAPVKDAIFWLDRIAVLTATEVRAFDLFGCPAQPASVVTGLDGALGLGVSDEGFLMVVQHPANTALPNVRMFLRDGTEVLAPSTFDARGFYARHRNPAFVFDPVSCAYELDGSRVVGAGCCAEAARPLTDDESLFFRLVYDLRDLRARTAYPPSGQAIIGPAQPEDPLDSGLPGIQWDRILLFGDIPQGCAVQVETRAFDDILGGDPLVPTGWSAPVTATTSSAVQVAPPGDTRQAAAAAMVLAEQGRFLWIRLTLVSNGLATPRITGIEVESPRDSIGRFLPKFIQDSTPEDDFLRRWLSIFENTAFDGVALRMDDYAELFDPRTAPAEMLPFLAGWLQVLELARFQQDEQAFRFALTQADALARSRGTVDGLILAVSVYMGINVQIVESFKRASGFILGTGTTIDGVVGPALGCQTGLSAEPGPTWLGDAPLLGETFLLDCERRFGTVPFHFEVLVPARDVCRSEDLALLKSIIEIEKPAHTTFRIRQTGVAGFVVGDAILGQSTGKKFDRNELDPATFGVLVQNGPPRPAPIGEGFTLGAGARLFGPAARAGFQLNGMLGRSTRI